MPMSPGSYGLPIQVLVFDHSRLTKIAFGSIDLDGDPCCGLPLLRRVLHPELEDGCPQSCGSAWRALQGEGLKMITTFNGVRRIRRLHFGWTRIPWLTCAKVMSGRSVCEKLRLGET